MRRYLWVILMAGGLLATGLHAAEGSGGSARLRTFFSQVRSFTADFEQQVMAEDRSVTQTSRGHMALKIPGRFRWDYQEPYAQTIVGDGEKVWIYDADLEQVTVRSQRETLGTTPAELLTSGENIDKNFQVTDLGVRDGIQWLALSPREDNSEFNSIRLAFAGKVLARMQLQDSFGNTTVLSFNNVQLNREIDDALFRFVPPPGVDVVGP